MKRWIIVIGALIVIGLGAFIYYDQTHLLLRGTTPSDGNAKAATTTSIIMVFNKKLADSTVANFSISPRVQGRTLVNGNELVFTPNSPLQLHRAYTATLSSAKAANGQTSGPVSITFTTAYIPFNQLSQSNKQAQINQTDLLEKKYPIVQKIPHQTLHYKIDYTVQSDGSLKLIVTLYAILNRPDQYNTYLAQLAQYKQEALEYLRQNGADPANFSITYDPPAAATL